MEYPRIKSTGMTEMRNSEAREKAQNGPTRAFDSDPSDRGLEGLRSLTKFIGGAVG
jgi:hypothetical protein